MNKILVVDDDQASCRTLQLHLRSQDFQVTTAHSVDEGLAAINGDKPDLIILDIRMPGKSGLEGLPEFKTLLPRTPVIMITAFHDMESTIDAMQRGAEDYIHKPIDIDELDAAIHRILSARDSDETVLTTERSAGDSGTPTMVGRSRAMKEVFKTIGLVAKNPATVLITGDSGTGKELVARAIHRSGTNPDGPFVAVNCAALVETLLESDMFGHEKGAFTGAVTKQAGKFALAQDGTIFLDEISEMSLAMQAKLLRVLQNREFTPLGGKSTLKTNARVIAATNVDLLDRVHEGLFREDLYYRLQVVNIHLPPLRERKEDILDLTQALLARINQDMHSEVNRITQQVLDCFYHYDWPGNVRELENVLMKSVALCPGNTLTADLLPNAVCEYVDSNGGSVSNIDSRALAEQSLEEIEKAHVERVLKAHNWHRGQTCEVLGVSRPRLRRMIRQYNLTPPNGMADTEEADELENGHNSE